VTEPEPASLLLDTGQEIGWPDADAEAATGDLLRADGRTEGTLGRLGDIAVWLSGLQGVAPPREPSRPRLIVFSAEHAVPDQGLAEPSAVIAAAAAITMRVVEVGSGQPGPTPADLATTDAMTAAGTTEAIAAGIKAADDEIDSGADLLAVGVRGSASITAATAIISVMTLTEPIKVVGTNTARSDQDWMRFVATVRDARLRGLPHRHDAEALLTTIGAPDLAALAGFLIRAAARRTPVLLDGTVVAAAALVARDVSPNLVRWWQTGSLSRDAAHRLALDEFGATPLLELSLASGDGTGAVLAIALVQAAARVAAIGSEVAQADTSSTS
jgi:nicotinate-nucleotide--dimethylbenzimidazole phosphoribosyltransferase